MIFLVQITDQTWEGEESLKGEAGEDILRPGEQTQEGEEWVNDQTDQADLWDEDETRTGDRGDDWETKE